MEDRCTAQCPSGPHTVDQCRDEPRPQQTTKGYDGGEHKHLDHILRAELQRQVVHHQGRADDFAALVRGLPGEMSLEATRALLNLLLNQRS